MKPTPLFALLCLAVGSSPSLLAEDSTPLKPAEDSGWELVFSDDFDREELGEDWEVVDGDWTMEEGGVTGSGTLISARGFPGDFPTGFLRLEFDATSDVKPIIFFENQPKPKVGLGDMSSFIHVQDPEKTKGPPWSSGYFFQFGGQNNTLNKILRAGTVVVEKSDPETIMVQDKTHQIVVENDEGTLRFYVDGELLFEEEEPASIMGDGYDRVGFFFYTKSKISSVKVYTKRLPNDLDLD